MWTELQLGKAYERMCRMKLATLGISLKHLILRLQSSHGIKDYHLSDRSTVQILLPSPWCCIPFLPLAQSDKPCTLCLTIAPSLWEFKMYMASFNKLNKSIQSDNLFACSNPILPILKNKKADTVYHQFHIFCLTAPFYQPCMIFVSQIDSY